MLYCSSLGRKSDRKIKIVILNPNITIFIMNFSVPSVLVHRLSLGNFVTDPDSSPVSLRRLWSCKKSVVALLENIHNDCAPRIQTWKEMHLELMYPNKENKIALIDAFKEIRTDDPTKMIGEDMDINYMVCWSVGYHFDKNKIWTDGTYQILIPTGLFDIDPNMSRWTDAYQSLEEQQSESKADRSSLPVGSLISDPYARSFLNQLHNSWRRVTEKVNVGDIYVLDTDKIHGFYWWNSSLRNSFIWFRVQRDRIHALLDGTVHCSAIEQ